MSVRHSPTPWALDDEEDPSLWILDSNSASLCKFPAVPQEDTDDDEEGISPRDRADAAFIVQACNAHEDFVSAAKAAVAYDKAIMSCANNPAKMATFCTAEGDDLDSLYADWIEKSRAALAKAGAA